MIYYRDEELLIRDLEEQDAQAFLDGVLAQGWHERIEKYLDRLKDQREGRAVALAALWQGQAAGYINVYPNARDGAFGGQGLPEIVDFCVLEKFQRRGIGSRLMDAAERIAGQYAGRVYLGVGLHSGYGTAQRMYVKRGYIPDGSGVWYGGRVCGQYEACSNDDDLVLYMSKVLQAGEYSACRAKEDVE